MFLYILNEIKISIYKKIEVYIDLFKINNPLKQNTYKIYKYWQYNADF